MVNIIQAEILVAQGATAWLAWYWPSFIMISQAQGTDLPHWLYICITGNVTIAHLCLSKVPANEGNQYTNVNGMLSFIGSDFDGQTSHS